MLIRHWPAFRVFLATIGILFVFLYFNYVPRFRKALHQDKISVAEILGKAFSLTKRNVLWVLILGGIFLFVQFGVLLIGANVLPIFALILAYAVFVQYLVMLDHTLRTFTNERSIERTVRTTCILTMCSIVGFMSWLITIGVLQG